ncbi:MAG: GTP-binding protein, partial [Burkholderiales bacterium]
MATSAAHVTPLPIVLLTGFLGTGKTTLLRRLLTDPALADTAVLINELGEIGLDHKMVFGEGGTATGDAAAGLRATLLLANGCVCCTVRDDLAIALDDLLMQRASGRIPAFSQVIIETTGLANPVPIIESLRASPIAATHYKLAKIVCTVDAAAPLDRLDRQPESLAQVVVADTLLITRGDLAGTAAVDTLRERLHRLNPDAMITSAVNGEISPAALFGVLGKGAATDDGALARATTLPAARSTGPLQSIGPIRPIFHSNVRTQTLRFAGPSVWGDTVALLDAMAAEVGEELLRVKGVLR